MRLGPDGLKKIAILGSAPSSLNLAPFKDPEWAIWCCSPALYPQVPKSDVWFELHRYTHANPGKNVEPGTRPWHSAEFGAFLAKHQGPVFMSEVHKEIPNSVRYPFEEMIEKHGPYFFSSTVCWMLALAIEQKPDVIGLWGVDMAATEEYSYQRPACQHFIGMAKALGIQIILPPESDLMRPPLMYGIGEHSERHIKINARITELEAQKAAVTAQYQQALQQMNYFQGAIDQGKYFLQTWSDEIKYDDVQAFSMAGQFVRPPEVAKHVPQKKHKGNGVDHHPITMEGAKASLHG